MQQDVRPAFAYGGDEDLDELVVFGAAHALVLPADIKRIRQVFLIVGADVEQDRQRGRRMQPGAGGVERELADRNAHAAGALIAEPEDAFAVADHDGFDFVVARMAEDAADQVLVRDAEKQAARLAKDMAEQLAAETDRRRIDDRHHLFDVAGQHRVEQGLVGILQAAQEHVALDVAAEPAKGVEPAHDLVIELGDVRRQEPVQVERVALVLGEGRALVEDRIVEQLVAAQRRLDVWRRMSCASVPAPKPRYDTGERERSTGFLRQRRHKAGLAAARGPASPLPKATPLASVPMAVRMTITTATVPATAASAMA